jgi:tetratricopeptide (TPR) repeat protein
LEYNHCHADALHNLALIDLIKNDLESAEEHEVDAHRCQPDMVQAVVGMGAIRKALGELHDAYELFSQAVQMDPGYLDARRNLILVAIELGEIEEVDKQMARLAVLAPEDPFLKSIRFKLSKIEAVQ